MGQPLINILIRASRPELFNRCIASIDRQTYKTVRVIVYDDSIGVDHDLVHTVVTGEYDRSKPFFFNQFINDLMHWVGTGWVLVLDDDDTLSGPNVLTELATHLTDIDKPIICQMLRNELPKPSDAYIDRRWVVKGYIGMPCLIINAKHKYLYHFEAVEDADFRWIDKVSKTLSCKFVKQVVVNVGSRPNGGNSK